MKTLQILPEGWPCRLDECKPGPFTYHDTVGFKTEYVRTEEEFKGDIEVYVLDSGEMFWGGVTDRKERSALIVQPCVCLWVIEE